MNRFTPYLGALGLGFALAGVVLFALQRTTTQYWLGFLLIGVILLTAYAVANRRALGGALAHRSTQEGANSAALAVIVVAIAGLVNYVANREARQWDFTASRQYSLSDQTLRILDELDQDVTLVLLDRLRTESQLRASDVLKLYDDASPRVRVELIDPEREPERAVVYTSPSEPLELGTVLLQVEERIQRVSDATEPEITNGLIRALSNESRIVYFTTGHDEKVLTDTGPTGISIVAGMLTGSGYETRELVIARSSEGDSIRVPEDADALVVAGPRRDFLPVELEALDAYIDSGGHVVCLVDPETQAEVPELVATLVERGIVLGNDVVVDPLAQPPLYPVVQSYGVHPIVERFGNGMSIFAFARSVSMADEVPEGTEVRELFATLDEQSWAETHLEELTERSSPRAEQQRGPIGLAMAASIPTGSEDVAARMVVVGDSDFVANELTSNPILNADLFLNMVNWAVGDEGLISIRPREPEERRVVLNAQQRRNVDYLVLFILPGVVVITGLSRWWGRR